jgi:hypothetical protein
MTTYFVLPSRRFTAERFSPKDVIMREIGHKGAGGRACREVFRGLALAVHLQDVDMMGKPVEQGAGEPFRTEY